MSRVLIISLVVIIGITIAPFISMDGYNPTREEFNNLKAKVELLENKPANLEYPMSEQNRNILKDIQKEFLPEMMMDALWDNLVYWSTFYESPDGWTLTGTPVFIGGEINITANSGNVGIEKVTNNRNLLRWDRNQRMRMNFVIESSTKQSMIMIIGTEQVAGSINSHFGFKIVDTVLYGICGDAATGLQSETVLKMLVAGTVYEIEARYTYGDKIIFYVDGVEVGNLQANLPRTNNDAVNDYNPSIVEIMVTSSEVANKILISSFFEYIRIK